MTVCMSMLSLFLFCARVPRITKKDNRRVNASVIFVLHPGSRLDKNVFYVIASFRVVLHQGPRHDNEELFVCHRLAVAPARFVIQLLEPSLSRSDLLCFAWR